MLLMPAAAASHVGVACSSEHFPVGTAGDMQIAKERAQDAAHKVISSHLTFLGKDVFRCTLTSCWRWRPLVAAA